MILCRAELLDRGRGRQHSGRRRARVRQRCRHVNAALSTPGSVASFKVKFKTTSGNEKGSNTVTIVRPPVPAKWTCSMLETMITKREVVILDGGWPGRLWMKGVWNAVDRKNGL